MYLYTQKFDIYYTYLSKNSIYFFYNPDDPNTLMMLENQ